jgi:hypothetical protein
MSLKDFARGLRGQSCRPIRLQDATLGGLSDQPQARIGADERTFLYVERSSLSYNALSVAPGARASNVPLSAEPTLSRIPFP